MAGPTRLELATSCVTGRRSNRLNYGPGRESDCLEEPLQQEAGANFTFTRNTSVASVPAKAAPKWIRECALGCALYLSISAAALSNPTKEFAGFGGRSRI